MTFRTGLTSPGLPWDVIESMKRRAARARSRCRGANSVPASPAPLFPWFGTDEGTEK